jgi:toxin ParE1/3/4
MACKLIWSPAARDDLRDIVRFIARDNPRRAESFGYELMTRTDILHDHPEAGRIVPEYRNPRIREIIYRPYRIVYRLDIERQLVEIARVWHAARGNPLV